MRNRQWVSQLHLFRFCSGFDKLKGPLILQSISRRNLSFHFFRLNICFPSSLPLHDTLEQKEPLSIERNGNQSLHLHHHPLDPGGESGPSLLKLTPSTRFIPMSLRGVVTVTPTSTWVDSSVIKWVPYKHKKWKSSATTACLVGEHVDRVSSSTEMLALYFQLVFYNQSEFSYFDGKENTVNNMTE